MTVFDVVKQLKLDAFCDLMYGTARSFGTQEELKAALQTEVTEKELKKFNDIALQEGRQPVRYLDTAYPFIHGTLDCDCKKELNDLAKRIEFLEKQIAGYTFDEESRRREPPKGNSGPSGKSGINV